MILRYSSVVGSAIFLQLEPVCTVGGSKASTPQPGLRVHHPYARCYRSLAIADEIAGSLDGNFLVKVTFAETLSQA